MSRSSYGSTVWKPLRESAIVGSLCVLVPMILASQVIALLYPGTVV